MERSDSQTPPETHQRRNHRLIFLSGALSTIGGQLANPTIVLPFLYLALGAPTVIAGLLLPFVTGSRLISEIFVSPFVNNIVRAKVAVYATDILTALALALVAIFATSLTQVLLILLFLITAIVMGLCQGVNTIGTNQVYGTTVAENIRNRMVFAQATISGILAILVVWLTRDLMASDKPMQQHIVVLWCGILALTVAGLSFVGVKLLEGRLSSPAAEAPARPLAALARGFKTGMAYGWFRRFLLTRVAFISVELAMPFYTIHAATFHIGTHNALSYFVMASSAGIVIGSLVWNWISGRYSVNLSMVLGCIVSAASAVLALTFTFTGMAQEVWSYALVILLLSFGSNGVIYGRYLYLIEMTNKSERPYLVAMGDVTAGMVGMAFAAVLSLLAHLHDPVTPLFVLVALNGVAVLAGLRLPRSGNSTPATG